MEKNIAVIDAEGNVYEATWPKRARGLVKSGRARFVNQNTICLARPPVYAEGKCMNTFIDPEGKTGEAAAVPEQGPNDRQEIPDTAYVVRKIDEILAGNAELRAAIAQWNIWRIRRPRRSAT